MTDRVNFKQGIIFALILFSGCQSYRIPTEEIAQNPESCSSLYNFVPCHRCQIKPFDIGHWTTWALFGNDDDGLFGEGEHAHYQLDKKSDLKKAICWWVRNPLHNFCFYVIGSAYRENSHYDLIKTNPPLYFEVSLNGGKPFVEFDIYWCPHRRTIFYVGWRERGNFGLKANLYKTLKPKL